MSKRRGPWPSVGRLGLVAGVVMVLVVALAPPAWASTGPTALANQAATASTSVTAPGGAPPPAPAPVPSPPGIRGPSLSGTASPTTTTGPAAPTPGPSSPGLFDIAGHIRAAIDSWFKSLVTSALNPVLGLLGHSLLATPDLTANARVTQLWKMAAGIADALLLLLVLAGGAIVMSHETLQTRTAAKDVAPRIVVATLAANASLALAGPAIALANGLSEALLGQGVNPAQAASVLTRLVVGPSAGGGIFLVLLAGVVAVLAIVVLATYVIRLALTVLLVVAAPLALTCHALPQTEGLAKLWWRGFSGVLLVQVGQSLVLVAALRVFLATGGNATLGLGSSGGLVDLLVSACLCWVLIRIPAWVGRYVLSSGHRSGGVVRLVRNIVVYRVVRGALAAVV